MNAIRFCALVALLSPATVAAQQITAGTMAYLAERSTSFNGVVGTGSTAMLGLEIGVQTKYVGLLARAAGGDFDADSTLAGAGKIATGEIRLIGGPKIAHASAGYGRRTLDGALSERAWTFLRLGAGTQLDFGGSGFSGQLEAGYYTGVGGNGTFDKGSGADVETRLVYQPHRFPVYLALGYRRERFLVSEGNSKRPDIVSSIVFGAGMSLGKR